MASQQGPTELVGPDYRPTSQKPEATVSTELSHANVHILPQTPQLLSLLTYVPSTRTITPQKKNISSYSTTQTY